MYEQRAILMIESNKFRHNFIKDLVIDRQIEIKYFPSGKNIADIGYMLKLHVFQTLFQL